MSMPIKSMILAANFNFLAFSVFSEGMMGFAGKELVTPSDRESKKLWCRYNHGNECKPHKTG